MYARAIPFLVPALRTGQKVQFAALEPPLVHTHTRDAPEVAMDFCFLAKDTSDATLAVLVTKDPDSRAILAHP
eukprot:5618583-Alexandrium_andersonii.AAC.1